ncbi:MAG: helix-turn-helix transcriptional regulator [Clostridia bacterium]|nr:helix-turn-helix transcriptional regulator [Clostridia bacterium]
MSTNFSFCIKQEYKKNYFIQNHTHPCYELVYYVQGEGTTTVGDQVYSFSPGSFIITEPNQVHKESSDNPVTVKFIGFTTDDEPLTPGIYTDLNNVVSDTIDEILEEIENKQTHYQTMMNLLAKKIIVSVLRLSPENYYVKSSFEYIQNYIKMNANKNTTIQQLAKDLNYNYDYLRQLFLSQLKISAKKYFFDVKLQNTKNLLLNSDLTVKQVADITGFSSASHLCSAFRQHFGMSPLQFRKKQRRHDFLKNKYSVVREEKKKNKE